MGNGREEGEGREGGGRGEGGEREGEGGSREGEGIEIASRSIFC